MNTFKIKIEEITFDLEDEEMSYGEEIKLQSFLKKDYLNKTFMIEAETEEEAHDELLEMVTDDTGWCIYSMDSVTL